MAEGVLVRWVKQIGENIDKGDVLAEIETDKATVEVESPASGVILQFMVDQGDVVPVSAPIAVVGEEGEEVEAPAETPEKTEEKKEEKPASEPAPQPASTQQTSSTPEGDRIKASPLAKKMASDKNIDLANLEGSGPGGRIVKKDVEAALESGPAAGKPSAPSAVSTMVSGEDETVQLTKLRQAIARRMTDSKTSVPHFYVTHEYNMDAVMAMRKQANEYLSDDEKLSVNDFIIKSVALALREFPNLNASFGGEQVIRHGNINIGIAVAVEGGLLTVVNKNTDQQLLRAISGDIKQKVARARDGKVKPDDIEGSTFSISNMGMFDVEHFIAIINPPEAAILAVGSARQVPVVEDGEIKPGWRMKATISVDHRVSDGAEAAQFMQKLAEFLENPVRMLV
jgi:pyruvate dehydrogenase E2 component (dihydrolipoamide acetyltransferase)